MRWLGSLPFYQPWKFGHLEGEQPRLLTMVISNLLTGMILQEERVTYSWKTICLKKGFAAHDVCNVMVSGNKTQQMYTNVLCCLIQGTATLFCFTWLKKNTYTYSEDWRCWVNWKALHFYRKRPMQYCTDCHAFLLDLCLLVIFSGKLPWNSLDLDNLFPYSQLSEPNPKVYLEDHPRTCKWLVTPIYKPFNSHLAHLEGE